MEEKKNKIFYIVIISIAVVILVFNVFSYFGASIMLPGRTCRDLRDGSCY